MLSNNPQMKIMALADNFNNNGSQESQKVDVLS